MIRTCLPSNSFGAAMRRINEVSTGSALATIGANTSPNVAVRRLTVRYPKSSRALLMYESQSSLASRKVEHCKRQALAGQDFNLRCRQSP